MSKTKQSTSLPDAAVASTYAERGMAVFACHAPIANGCSCGTADCKSPAKHPRTRNGLKNATQDINEIRLQFNQDANIGLPTGQENQIIVIDIDPRHGGDAKLAEMEAEHSPLPPTVEVFTGGGGRHLYFRYPIATTIGSRNGWRSGIDIKSDGGYVIAPPSVHASGHLYEWRPGHALCEIEMADLPDWLLPLLPQKRADESPAANPSLATNGRAIILQRAQQYAAKASAATEGNRNDSAFKLSGHVAAFVGEDGERLSESDIVGVMQTWNLRNEPPLSHQELQTCVASAMRNGSERPAKEVRTLPHQSTSRELLAEMPESVCNDARAMLESPNLLEQIRDDVCALGVAGERELVASIYLVGVSRLLERPLAAIVQATTSSGKSYVVDKTTQLFPPEAAIFATSLTPQALSYMPPGSLSHRLIVAGERSRREDDKAAEATRSLREMISSGRLTKLVPNKEDGKFTTEAIEQSGPIAYVETTSMQKIFEEDANRCLLLAADEREEQTKAILHRLAASYSGLAPVDYEGIIARHHAAQRMLEQRPVIVPFAERLAESFDTGQIVSRRAFPQLMGVIQASALLHQYQRECGAGGQLIATADDYRIARGLCRAPIARSLRKFTSKVALDFHGRLNALGKSEFSTADAARKESVSGRTVQKWLNELRTAGAVVQVKAHRGNEPAEWRLMGMDRAGVAIGGFELPSVEQVCA